LGDVCAHLVLLRGKARDDLLVEHVEAFAPPPTGEEEAAQVGVPHQIVWQQAAAAGSSRQQMVE
jgi:hypothetical protein